MSKVSIGDQNQMTMNVGKENDIELMQQLGQAIELVRKSNELVPAEIQTLCELIKEAQKGVSENNAEAISSVKGKFDILKNFILNRAPQLIASLANLTKVATFFGLDHHFDPLPMKT